MNSQVSAATLCCYTNATRHIQIVRIVDLPNWYFERVVFPGERLMFEAPQAAHLEIHAGARSTLTDTISCERLRVRDSDSIASLLAACVP
ncbi:DUF1830 domain-containing protein [Leptolyngbya sp. NIES-2104]|uniref:DUF1830 domain-containing protein n=1 Tax=Leptolyngbya sp. NIES-2104 TaxID=1552121 RepID=UPI0006ECA83B|nr:DUF1830 domain-containing protein [Leptolyngbya sp. NIES-2104]GAP99038.1 hypothetical protein NIES2104_55950 [Leptolyngbya sp. NIES-2104]